MCCRLEELQCVSNVEWFLVCFVIQIETGFKTIDKALDSKHICGVVRFFSMITAAVSEVRVQERGMLLCLQLFLRVLRHHCLLKVQSGTQRNRHWTPGVFNIRESVDFEHIHYQHLSASICM